MKRVDSRFQRTLNRMCVQRISLEMRMKHEFAVQIRGRQCSNSDPDPLKYYEATEPAFNVGPPLARQRNAI